MKLMLCAGAVLALTTMAASADQFSGFYGNTVHQTRPDGSTSTIFVNADMTWEQHAADSKTAHGTWSWKDDTHFCIKVVEPAPKPGEQAHEECNEITGNHKAGDTWTETDGEGHSVSLSITAGR